ncbi:hypothetical protein SNEBB_008906 [Seison nebaliae]|nr:hypothetical protein SNEBB_008906 [Seison nebaliae]
MNEKKIFINFATSAANNRIIYMDHRELCEQMFQILPAMTECIMEKDVMIKFIEFIIYNLHRMDDRDETACLEYLVRILTPQLIGQVDVEQSIKILLIKYISAANKVDKYDRSVLLTLRCDFAANLLAMLPELIESTNKLINIRHLLETLYVVEETTMPFASLLCSYSKNEECAKIICRYLPEKKLISWLNKIDNEIVFSGIFGMLRNLSFFPMSHSRLLQLVRPIIFELAEEYKMDLEELTTWTMDGRMEKVRLKCKFDWKIFIFDLLSQISSTGACRKLMRDVSLYQLARQVDMENTDEALKESVQRLIAILISEEKDDTLNYHEVSLKPNEKI